MSDIGYCTPGGGTSSGAGSDVAKNVSVACVVLLVNGSYRTAGTCLTAGIQR